MKLPLVGIELTTDHHWYRSCLKWELKSHIEVCCLSYCAKQTCLVCPRLSDPYTVLALLNLEMIQVQKMKWCMKQDSV